VKLWDLSRQQEYVAVGVDEDGGPIRVEGVGFSKDSKRLRVLRANGTLQTVDAGTGAEIERRSIDVSNENSAPRSYSAFSPDGLHAACVTRDNHRLVKVVNLETGEVERKLEHPYETMRVAYSADGRRLATSCADQKKATGKREIAVWDMKTGDKLLT